MTQRLDARIEVNFAVSDIIAGQSDDRGLTFIYEFDKLSEVPSFHPSAHMRVGHLSDTHAF